MNTSIRFKKLAGLALCASMVAGASFGTTFNFDSASMGKVEDVVSSFKAYNTDGSSLIAEVTDEVAYSGGHSLKLFDNSADNKPFARTQFINGAAATGSLETMVYLPTGNLKSTYINVGTGKNNADRFFEVKFSGSGVVQYENGNEDPEIGSVALDKWVKLTLTWDETTFSVMADGVVLVESAPVLITENTPTGVTMYTGDKKNVNNVAYIDDLTSDLF